MTTQNYFSFFILVLFFIQIHAFVPCKRTHRACPDGYTCSWNGVFCKQNEKDDLRSRWSLLENDCLDGSICGPNHYCLDHKSGCISREVSSCDSYLNAITKSGCNKTYLVESFQTCSDFYIDYYTNLPYSYLSAMQCGDQCIRDKISFNIQRNKEDSCSLRETYAVGNYTHCYYACEACSVEKTWSVMFKNIKKWGNFNDQVGRDFAQRCSQEYLSKRNEWKISTIKTTAQGLINSISTNLDVDTSDLFKDVMALEDATLTTPKPCPTTTLATSTISPQTSSPSQSVSFHHQKYHFWLLLVIGFTFLVIIFLAIFLVKFIKKSNTLSKNLKRERLFWEEHSNTRVPLPPSPNIPVPARPLVDLNSDSGSSRYEAARNSADEHVRFHSAIPSSIRRP